MTKLAYLECPTGIAGDMCLGALIHVGVPLDYLTEKLGLLGIASEYKLWSELVHRNGQQATKLHVDLVANNSEAGSTSQPNSPSSANPTRDSSLHTHQPSISHLHPHPPHDSSTHLGDRVTASPRVTSAAPPESLSLGEANSFSHHHTVHAHGGRHLPEIEHLITTAKLPTRVETWSLAVFRRLAEAEAAVHGIAPEQVHFHEVGATDAIVDVVGTCLGLDWLDIDQLYCSPMPVGGGVVRAAHGQLPVPAPAVLKLWEMRQVPLYSNGIERELVTPTGAAIATTLATQFGPPPAMVLQQIGLGAGSRDLILPNILRLWIGEATAKNEERKLNQHSSSQFRTEPSDSRQPLTSNSQVSSLTSPPFQETVAVLETQIDDLNPQAIGYVFEGLFAEGALDVFTQAIGMKKSRPGILLTVICTPAQVAACTSVIFRETTTLGIRHSNQQRAILHREIQTVELPYGTVRIKVARQKPGGAIVNVQPEYEDCAQLARQFHHSWREVHRLALSRWYQQTNERMEAENGF